MDELSKQLLAGAVEKNSEIVMDLFDDKIVFRKPIKDSEKSNGSVKKKKEKV